MEARTHIRPGAGDTSDGATSGLGTQKKPISNDIPLSLKSTLVDDTGLTYREFRASLEPRWRRVWIEIAAAYLVIASTLTALVVWDPGMPAAIPASVVGALLIGYTLQFLNLFFHEAGHYNLVPGRARNDLVTNVLMGWLFGSSIATYRRIHFQHHRALGTTMDSETAYFDALGMRYLVGGLLGTKALTSFARRNRVDRQSNEGKGAESRSRLLWLIIAAVANLALVVLLAGFGSLSAAIAWAAGLLMVFPFLSSLRQLLEHRSEEAHANVDYTQVDHGPVNRLFGEGPLASTLGSAGFNRHAIHHWEPQASYTRLRDIEGYLLRTDAAPAVRERQTSYRETFLRLLEL